MKMIVIVNGFAILEGIATVTGHFCIQVAYATELKSMKNNELVAI